MWQLSFVYCWFINPKIVDYQLGISILWNAQIAPDRTIFIKIFPGEHAPGPPPPQHESGEELLQSTYAPAL